MLVLITALELPLQHKVRGQRSVSDPTTADQCRGGGAFTTSLESGVTSQLKSSVVSFPGLPTATNMGKKPVRRNTHSAIEPDIPPTELL